MNVSIVIKINKSEEELFFTFKNVGSKKEAMIQLMTDLHPRVLNEGIFSIRITTES